MAFCLSRIVVFPSTQHVLQSFTYVWKIEKYGDEEAP
jgi:hypothetical protein